MLCRQLLRLGQSVWSGGGLEFGGAGGEAQPVVVHYYVDYDVVFEIGVSGLYYYNVAVFVDARGNIGLVEQAADNIYVDMVHVCEDIV